MKKIGGYLLVSLGLVLALSTGGTWWYYKDAIHVEQRSFADLRDLLEPNIEFYLPEREGPAPAVVFVHGCGGLSPATEPRARTAQALGYVAVVQDSITPRGLDWPDVCDGRVLQGAERVGDLLVTLQVTREHPAVDPEKIVVVAYSHGAWTALEAFALDEALPSSLADSPGHHLAGVEGLVAWYPYCGWGVGFSEGWAPEIPTLVLLAEKDEITEPGPCADIAARQADAGHQIRTITYPGVSHGFDRNEDWVKLYDPVMAKRALSEQASFLKQHLGSYP